MNSQSNLEDFAAYYYLKALKVVLVLDLRTFYKKAVSDLFGVIKTEDFSGDFIELFEETEKSIHVLISSSPNISVLNEILQDAYALAEKVAMIKPSALKRLMRLRDNYQDLISRAINKSLILSEELRLDGNVANLTCPECSKLLLKDLDFCPYCGIELLKCTVCGAVIGGNRGVVVCPKCGEYTHSKCMSEINNKCSKCGSNLTEKNSLP